MLQVHVAMEQETPVVGSPGMEDAAVAAPSDSELQSSDAAALRVVYLATAADTSCVSHDEGSRQRAVVSVGDVSQHMIMDIDGSDDDDDGTEVTQHSVADACSTATMIQRN